MSEQSKHDKKKAHREKEIQTKKHKENMEMPMNKFLNGDLPAAKILKNYHIQHLEPVIKGMRIIRSGIEDVRHYELKLKQYEKQYNEGPIVEKNKYGLVMSKEEVHDEITKITNVLIHEKLADMRAWIADSLLSMIDDVFTAQQFNDFEIDCINVMKSEGYDLFPEKIELVKIK